MFLAELGEPLPAGVGGFGVGSFSKTCRDCSEVWDLLLHYVVCAQFPQSKGRGGGGYKCTTKAGKGVI